MKLITNKAEITRRIKRLGQILTEKGINGMLVSSFANLYYLSGRVFSGYAYVYNEGCVTYYAKRPNDLEGPDVMEIRKPEDIAGIYAPKVALELGLTSYNTIKRLQAIFPNSEVVDATPILNQMRAVKSESEMRKLRQCANLHELVYAKIPQLYRPGMTDIELQIEIERELRLAGCLGQFRIAGDTMELFMGNLLCGDNALVPATYDFALGGAGLDPSLPVGANGTLIEHGKTVMVDMCGNFNGYMTDMSRTYAIDASVSPAAEYCHKLSIEICHRLAEMGRPGVEAKALYEEAVRMVKAKGLDGYFMGLYQKAGFIGHGVGIEVNELPVISPRSRDILQEGNVIALEPKFVLPGNGAVGIENTYVVRSGGMKPITTAPEEIISL